MILLRLGLVVLLAGCSQQSPPAPAPAPAPPPPAVEQARQLLAEARYAEAISLLAAPPVESKTCALLARAYLEVGQYDEAGVEVAKALQTGPPSAELYDLQGAALLARAFAQARYTETDSAIVSFNRALALEPNRTLTLYNLGMAHGYRDSTALAERYYRAALAADSTLAAAHKKLGLLYRRRGDDTLALAELSAATRLAPEDAEAQFHLALLYRESNQLDTALAAFKRAASLNPTSPQIQLNLASTYLRLGRRAEGEQALRRSEILRQYDRGIGSERTAPVGQTVAIGPATARYNLALNHALRGEYAQAVPEYRAALELNPELRNAHAGLGITLYLMGRLEEAATALNNAVALDSADAVNLTRLGLVRLKQGQNERARQALEQAARADTTLAEAAYGLGLLAARTQDYRTALVFFTRALALRPGYADAHLNLGVAHIHLGQHLEAAAAYEEAVAADPANPRAHLYLSDAYAKLGKAELSRSHREQARRLNEKND